MVPLPEQDDESQDERQPIAGYGSPILARLHNGSASRPGQKAHDRYRSSGRLRERGGEGVPTGSACPARSRTYPWRFGQSRVLAHKHQEARFPWPHGTMPYCSRNLTYAAVCFQDRDRRYHHGDPPSPQLAYDRVRLYRPWRLRLQIPETQKALLFPTGTAAPSREA